MNVQEHNQLMKVVFNGNKHLQHVLTSDQIMKLTMIENRYPLTRMPVCGHCEKLAYWNKESAYCPSCGTYTKSPVTYSNYLAMGYDVDNGIANKMMELDKRRRLLPDYGE